MDYCAAIKVWIHVILKWIKGISSGWHTWECGPIFKVNDQNNPVFSYVYKYIMNRSA